MNTLRDFLERFKGKPSAFAHFNIATLEQFKAAVAAVEETKQPLLVGASEGERKYFGSARLKQLVALEQSRGLPLFLNADHCKSQASAKEAIDLGFDEVLFDGSHLPFEENLKQAKEIVAYARSKNPSIIIEGEVGYLPGSSTLLKEAVELKPEYYTNPDLAKRFVGETGVDMLAISVGNLHGISIVTQPKLDFDRIETIAKLTGIPLVLHGGSGNSDEDFVRAIEKGIKIIHINTELRVLWREQLDHSLAAHPEVVTPYEVLVPVVDALQKKMKERIVLFGRAKSS